MADLLLILLASIGLSHIMVDGSIMDWVKGKLQAWDSDAEGNWKALEEQKWAWLRKLLSCYQCSGWHAGWMVGGIYLLSWLPGMYWLRIFLFAFAGSFVSMMGAVMLIYFNTGGSHDDGSPGD